MAGVQWGDDALAYDSAATRDRILRAARAEFAAHGLAGARVDRIAATAPANKKQIYVHFGSKEALFDSVITGAVEQLISEVPLTPDDLAGYTGRAYEAMTQRPEVFRLAMWRLLERPVATGQEQELYDEKIRTLERERPDLATAPAGTLALLLALAQTWLIASPVLDGLADGEVQTRRAQLEHAVDRLFPSSAPSPLSRSQTDDEQVGIDREPSE